MNCFDIYLQQISEQIALSDHDRQHYTQNYDTIRDYLTKIMCKIDPIFKRLFNGTSLFGSFSNHVRINKPTEFDVIIMLAFPFSSQIVIENDDDRPGYIKLNFENVLDSLSNVGSNSYDEMYDFLYDIIDDDYLNRAKLQQWLRDLITEGLEKYGSNVEGPSGQYWNLHYDKRGLAHTIFATSGNKKISIDFVPGIKFRNVDWIDVNARMPNMKHFEKWYASPKPTGGPKRTRKYAFLISNPEAEKTLLKGRQNLKIVFRLLKSLIKKKHLPRLKSYFLTTAFMWEVKMQNRNFWFNSLSTIFIHMLDKLDIYFDEERLPFFWNANLNLLDIYNDYELSNYSGILRETFLTMRTYKQQPHLSYAGCARHFKILDD